MLACLGRLLVWQRRPTRRDDVKSPALAKMFTSADCSALLSLPQRGAR